MGAHAVAEPQLLRRALLVMGVCAAVATAIWWLGVSHADGVPEQPLHQRAGEASPVFAEALIEDVSHAPGAAVRTFVDPPVLASTLRGTFRWTDGMPVVGAEVCVPGASENATTGRDGTFAVGWTPEDAGTVDVGIRPKCWFTARTMTTPVRLVDTGWVCEPVDLPDEVEIRLQVETESGFAEVITAAGFDRVRFLAFDAQGGFTTPPAGRLDVKLQSGSTAHVLSVRASPAVRLVCELMPSTFQARSGLQLPTDWTVLASREATQVVPVRLGMEQVLTGAVVDHLGAAVPGAQVRLVRPHALVPTRNLETILTTSRDGRFVCVGAAGVTEQVYAVVAGKSSPRGGITVGGASGRLVVDLSGHRRLRLVNGPEVIVEFDCGPNTKLFGRQEEPPLTTRMDGTCWLPDTESALWLTWREGGHVEEQRIRAPERAGDEIWTVDVGHLPSNYTGAIELERDVEDLPRYYIHLQLLEPADLLPVGNRSAGIFESRPHRFLGLPPGHYSLRIESRDGTELGSMRIDMAGGTRGIRLSELMAK